MEAIGRTLETMFGAREINTYVDRGEEYKVLVQARAEDRATPRDLSNMFVRSGTTSQLIPLSNLVTFREAGGPAGPEPVRAAALDHHHRRRWRPASPSPRRSTSSPSSSPRSCRRKCAWAIAARAASSRNSSSSLYFTFGLALLIVFLVLAAQFESWVHPFIIMLTVPLAVTGGLLALLLTGISLNVYSQIGMILLIGIMAKNGILIVEFANQLRDEGKSIA